jgi:zinc D-Ala-D-Ala dipeptidase
MQRRSSWQYAIVMLGMCWLILVIRMGASAQTARATRVDPRQWTEISASSGRKPAIEVSFPYATTDNFVRTKLYPCARCFLRPDPAKAVLLAHAKLQRQGYGGLRVFDCYRPRAIQRKMWAIKPDPRYVANPDRGSDHNRGTAVDLTILDRSGKPLDFGTPFDEFSPTAHHSYRNLSPQVKKNRSLLKSTMASVGFRHVDTEWWHYAWNGNKSAVADWVWDCNRERVENRG